VVAIGALLPAESDDGARRQGEASTVRAPERFDVLMYLMSPVEETPLGPASGPKKVGPALAQGMWDKQVADVVFRNWETENSDLAIWEGIEATTQPPSHSRRTELAMVMALAFASSALLTTTRRSPNVFSAFVGLNWRSPWHSRKTRPKALTLGLRPGSSEAL
jgi:hypothetical protein